MMHSIQLPALNELSQGGKAALQQIHDRFLQRLMAIARYIQTHARQRPIVLLSGPSGSGKTTTAYLIERFLDGWNMETHTLSMDHFFRTMTPQQRDLAAAGRLDLESPERLDIPYLNQQLQSILHGDPTWMPKYHFSTTTRQDQDWLLTRKPEELLILEGIHALNPDVIRIPDSRTVRIYVSVQTAVTWQDQSLLPEQLRLVRRMIRDHNFRSRDYAETLKMYPHVQEGEAKYITLHQSRAMFTVDTFQPYELGVYRAHLRDNGLGPIPHPLLDPLMAMWEEIDPVPMQDVPTDALVREFLGGSSFLY